MRQQFKVVVCCRVGEQIREWGLSAWSTRVSTAAAQVPEFSEALCARGGYGRGPRTKEVASMGTLAGN